MSSSKSISATSTSRTSDEETRHTLRMLDVLKTYEATHPVLAPGSANKNKAVEKKNNCMSCGKEIFTDDMLFCTSTPPAQIYGAGRTRVSFVPLCPSCIKRTKGMASIVCLGCKEVVLFVPPNKDNDGFTMEADETYHIVSCPHCDQGLKEMVLQKKDVKATPIEKLIYTQSNKPQR